MRIPRFGLGPVFGLECQTVPRRWQVYAGRVVFVGLLFAGLYFLWENVGTRTLTLADLHQFNSAFVNGVVVIQLLIVMLVAPAVTAGSICVDKARGTLHHVFVTDLSNRELILGKLGGRLLSVLALMACGMPVLALGGLLGGLDYGWIVRAYAITAGVAVLACTMAMFFSIWVRKPHQALLPVYAIFGLWVGFGFFDRLANANYPFMITPQRYEFLWWVNLTNPILASLTTFDDADPTRWVLPVAYLAATLGVSAVLTTIAIARVRKVVIGQSNRGVKRQKAGPLARILDYIPGPSLDGNPILWREWHRKRPTKWAGRFWTLYVFVSFCASGFVLFLFFSDPMSHHAGELAAFVNGVEVAVGLFLLTISATSSLAEERDRGSLDVIMTTPLSTPAILWGKWCGTFAMVPRLAILPLWVSSGLALVSGNYCATLALLGLILAYSAFISSLGLALAIWVPRLGRAIATGICVIMLMMVTLGMTHGYLMQGSFSSPLTYRRAIAQYDYSSGAYTVPDWDWLLLGNPYVGISETTRWSTLDAHRRRTYAGYTVYRTDINEGYGWVLVWMAVLGGVAVWLMMASISSFDRILGRMTTDIRLNSPRRVDPQLAAFPKPNSACAIRNV